MEQYTNKEHLKKLLDFLQSSIIHEPENFWFVDELHKLLPSTNYSAISSLNSSSLAKIEKYLGIDYRLDYEFSPNNYSFLKDDWLKEKIECDYREMMRYKYGLRGHKIDFAEFCRFIILQAELILNYYYYKNYVEKGGIQSAIEDIKELCKSAMGEYYYNPKNEVHNIEDIPFKYKLWAFKNKSGVSFKNIDLARRLRNEMCHRSVSPNENDIRELHKRIEEMGIKIKEDGSLPYMVKSLYNNKVVQKYSFERFILNQPFEELEKELQLLVEKVNPL